MEAELIQNLKDIGYAGPLIDPIKFNEALQGGAKSLEFTSLVSWLTYEIGSFENLDDTVHPITSPDDANSFLEELNIFLKELDCRNEKLTEGGKNEKLASIQENEALLEYLIIELMSSKILKSRNLDTQDKSMPITESTTAKVIREMISALDFTKPPENITANLFFKDIHGKVTQILQKVPKNLVCKPLFFGELNAEQWQELDKLHADLNEEYTIRREMLLQRFDVTINSFLWSERLKDKEREVNECYKAQRKLMKCKPDVTFAHLLSSRDDLAIIEKTSNASVRKNTRSAINSYIIGSVPDRGGRTTEHEPPPPETFKQNTKGQGSKSQYNDSGRYKRDGDGNSNSGGKFRDHKLAASNFGQNFDNPAQGSSFGNQDFSFGTQVRKNFHYNSNPNKHFNYGNQSSSSYRGNQSGCYDQYSAYADQSTSGYNPNSGYENQRGYNNRSAGGYNRGDQNRSRRVQGGWNQNFDTDFSSGNTNNYYGNHQMQERGRRH
ncbi:PREDICTED: protein FAM98B [Ceratosolen solmsi marchali]|uniref:Protein FAM98B n=1 Tax=Ceratosolen solmsi marchali TaxID=326594 RepID=A0AAJ7DVD7_9HYME|nr:PREDICTED: protein FAM98B [Ceratosolen solmsi marchali]